jgi:predicted nucleotidyltransferase
VLCDIYSAYKRQNLLYICTVSDLSTIQEKLRQIKPQLSEKYHVNSIGLFGSIVRTDFKPESDIDIVVDFSRPIGIEFVDLAELLEKLLNRKVDLVSRAGIRPQYFQAIEPDIVYV